MWLPSVRCAENCTYFHVYTTAWIRVKETRRCYSGQTSVNREKVHGSVFRYHKARNTGLWQHPPWPLLRPPMAIFSLCIGMNSAACLYSFSILLHFRAICELFSPLTKYLKLRFFYFSSVPNPSCTSQRV